MTRCPTGFDAPTFYDTLDWDAWTETADSMVDMGATAVRFGCVPWITGQANLDHLVRVLEDCKSRGLEVSFTTAQLDNNGAQDLPTAIAAGVAYIARLAPIVAPHVTWWQVLNEKDATSWRDYSTSLGSVYDGTTGTHARRPGMTDAYLEGLRDVLDGARQAIKAVNPAVKVGTSVTGVQVDEYCEACIWRPFFDIVAPVSDFMGINGYPMTWWRYYEEIPARMRRTSRRYDLPILITECGLPTSEDRGDEEEAMELVSHQIDRFSRSTSVDGVFVYQWRDRSDVTGAEAYFGVRRADGSMKTGHRAVRAMLRSLNS